MTLRICPPSLQWKVYMTLGRDAAVASYYQAARLVSHLFSLMTIDHATRDSELSYQISTLLIA